MLEDDLAGEHSVQMAMLLISVMSTCEKGFTHWSDCLCRSKQAPCLSGHESV
jgi:hypothetical protein